MDGGDAGFEHRLILPLGVARFSRFSGLKTLQASGSMIESGWLTE
jgi:hypothetical protein